MENIDTSAQMIAEVERLAQLMARKGVTRLEVRQGALFVQMDRAAAPASLDETMPPLFLDGYHSPLTAEATEEESSCWNVPKEVEICSTMVGYAQLMDWGLGSRIERGQPLARVEALGIPNDIVAPLTGIITAWLIEHGEAVQYGQPIALIEPLLEEEDES
jgi:acetyl-CoA carboxylase biotin carboxyl carrier protein